jgi:hypothetical protein
MFMSIAGSGQMGGSVAGNWRWFPAGFRRFDQVDVQCGADRINDE